MSAFLKLRGDGPAFLLESAEQGQRVGRYSFIGFRPRRVVRWSLGDGGDPYALAASEVALHRQAPLPGLPPFAGGAVGYFGYDLVRTVEPLGPPGPDPLGLPDMALMLSDLLVVFDHLMHTVSMLANVYAEDDVDRSYAAAREAIAEVRERLAGPVPVPARRRVREPMPEFESNMPRGALRGDGRADRRVRPRRRRLPGGALPALVGAGAGGGVLDLPRAAGGQPQPLHVLPRLRRLPDRRREPRAAAHRERSAAPPRGRSPARARAAPSPTTTRASRRELLDDPKERAEHVMLVDLGRNDLGRVCEYGSVAVEDFMTVETYWHVMHIVSSVAGTCARGGGDGRAGRLLPAGTLSGAPKVRAMQIIDELEPVKRGGYGGAVGYLSYTGDLDTCDPHPHGGGQGRRGPHPGRRRHRGRRQARLRVRRVAGQGPGVLRAIELAVEQEDWA